MRGYVLTFHPTTGLGTVVTESGRAYPFALADRRADLHGGDLVRCQVESTDVAAPHADRCRVMQIEVLQTGTDRLAASGTPLARELFHTVQMETMVH